MKAAVAYVVWFTAFFVGIWLADAATGVIYNGESFIVWWIVFLFVLPFAEAVSFLILAVPMILLAGRN